MSHKALFIADSLDHAHHFHQVFMRLGVDVCAGSTNQLSRLWTSSSRFDVVVYEATGAARSALGVVEHQAQESETPLLEILTPGDFQSINRPFMERCDYASSNASLEECMMRISRLLAYHIPQHEGDELRIDSMLINLATYQVCVNGMPIDLTYLEYALLAFFAKHPNQTFSRDALLQRVWGFDYYGGSRTVDVHVRRIRAKIGPDLAQRLETVRGVGYLWHAEIPNAQA